MKNDVQIQQDVVAELDREPNVINGTIGVEVHHGVVKLAGKVSDAGIKQNAVAAARTVEGVTTVVTDVDVAGASAGPGAGTIPQSTGDITRGPRIS
jgi:osmotically-inducible protein OsmY